MQGDDDRLSQTFAALANSTRRAILARLAQGEATVNELAAPFDLSLPAISKHIKVLERAGLIVQGQKAQYRPCTIDVTPLQEIATWTELYRPIWEARFDRMDDYLAQLDGPGQAVHPGQHPRNNPEGNNPEGNNPEGKNKEIDHE
ncbi:MAG: helix-turn-helix transcriptional regulator [Caldilineaceae bacterium]|nr:helix-turn-helix transcriptional regulator [Caldilineaceae bacterium]